MGAARPSCRANLATPSDINCAAEALSQSSKSHDDHLDPGPPMENLDGTWGNVVEKWNINLIRPME
jgi:hypothetical protein